MGTTSWSARAAGRVLRTRALVRAPIALYRHGGGWLFGQRLLMLEHRGRTSGLPRYVVLEVVARPAPDRYLVVAGFGERAQWLRNIRADPQVHVTVGFRRRRPARATELGPRETAAALQSYSQEHPRTWSMLRDTLEQTLGASVDAPPMVALDLS